MVNEKPDFTDKVCTGTIENCPRGIGIIRKEFKDISKGFTITKHENDKKIFSEFNKIREKCEEADCPYLKDSNNYVLVCTNCNTELLKVNSENKNQVKENFEGDICQNCGFPTISGREIGKEVFQLNLIAYYVHNSGDHLSGLVVIPEDRSKNVICHCAGWMFQKKDTQKRSCKHIKTLKDSL
ncbi:MAG: hypothetical protein ACOCP8_00955 [archaeon]